MVSHQGALLGRNGAIVAAASRLHAKQIRLQPQLADDFCALWHIFDLLPGGAGDWDPKFTYA